MTFRGLRVHNYTGPKHTLSSIDPLSSKMCPDCIAFSKFTVDSLTWILHAFRVKVKDINKIMSKIYTNLDYDVRFKL